MSLSDVAGIVERNGGMRVVVTQRWQMRHHVKRGERLFVVPGLKVQEPVPWDQIPQVIATTQKHVTRMLAPTNDCGTCHACCDLVYVKDKDFEKPSMQACVNCEEGFGCKVYNSRPKPCRDFACSWLSSQARNERMPPELRPDRCGTMFTHDTEGGDPLVFEVHTWKAADPEPVAWDYINEMQRAGYRAKKITYYVGEE